MMHHFVKENTRMGLISVFNFKSFDQFNPPRTTSNFRHLLGCGTIEFSLFAVSTGFVGRDD